MRDLSQQSTHSNNSFLRGFDGKETTVEKIDLANQNRQWIIGMNQTNIIKVQKFTVPLAILGFEDQPVNGNNWKHQGLIFTCSQDSPYEYIGVEKGETDDGSDTRIIFAAVTLKEAMKHIAEGIDHAAQKIEFIEFSCPSSLKGIDILNAAKVITKDYSTTSTNCIHFANSVLKSIKSTQKQSYTMKDGAVVFSYRSKDTFSCEATYSKIKSVDGFIAKDQKCFSSGLILSTKCLYADATLLEETYSCRKSGLSLTRGLSISTGMGYHGGIFRAELLGCGYNLGKDGIKFKILGNSVGLNFWQWFN